MHTSQPELIFSVQIFNFTDLIIFVFVEWVCTDQVTFVFGHCLHTVFTVSSSTQMHAALKFRWKASGIFCEFVFNFKV